MKMLNHIKSSSIIFCAKMAEYSQNIIYHNIADKKSRIDKFQSKGIETFFSKKVTLRFLNNTKSSYIIFCPKLFRYSEYIYYLQNVSIPLNYILSKTKYKINKKYFLQYNFISSCCKTTIQGIAFQAIYSIVCTKCSGGITN